MRNLCSSILRSWGTTARPNLWQYAWILSMFGLLAALEWNRLGLFLVPPFGATLTLLLVLPEASVTQPWPVIAGSVAGSTTGTLLALFAHGSAMAIAAAVLAFAAMNLIRAYHPPGVALAMYPLLLRPGHWFPLAVVFPFTLAAVGSAALLSRFVSVWPPYPKPLDDA
ncbi:MAG: HPP family protein [Terracidiphilus sp.]